jgi:hypothetical protein
MIRAIRMWLFWRCYRYWSAVLRAPHPLRPHPALIRLEQKKEKS